MTTIECKQPHIEKFIIALLPLVGAILFAVSQDNKNSNVPGRISQPVNHPTPLSTLSVPSRQESEIPINPQSEAPIKPEPYQLQPEQIEILKSMLEKLVKSSFKDWKSGIAISKIAKSLLQTQERGRLLNDIAFASQIANEYVDGIVLLHDQAIINLINEIAKDPVLFAEFEKFIDLLFHALMGM